jgi:hypothetical protein
MMQMARKTKLLWRGLLLALAALLVTVCGRPALAAKEGWPLIFTHEKGTVTLYQPQLEDFKDDRLMVRAAVSVKLKTKKEPVFGVVWITARALTDRDTRMVTIDQPVVTEVKFQDAKPEQLEKLKEFLNEEIEDRTHTISLDRILAAMEVLEKERGGDAGLKNDPPKIIFVAHPAVLVPLDGEPKLLPIKDMKLMRVANTAFLMVYDPAAKTYFLKGGETWLEATDLQGPWKDVKTLPAAVKSLDEAIAKDNAAAGKKVEAKAGKMPEIIVSTEPAELLATDGEPQFTPITGTNLLFVSNTESNIFMDTGSQDYYVLLSGRWFTTKSLKDGPWTYVPANKLPADFAKIPEKSTKGFVLANVAGTAQAKEAVLDNYIPQTAAIDRKKATIQVKYDGPPKFEKIANTDLEYATNTDKAVLKEGSKYYAVDQGVWYEADSPEGPWQVSVSPPKDVEKIPASNPLYNTKYVKVYDSNKDTVYVGYTPGYTGSYTSQDGTTVYGTGYQYPSYSSDSAYIPSPSTYGYSTTYDPYEASWAPQPSYYTPWAWLGAGLATAAVTGLRWAAWNNWWDHRYPGAGFYGNNWWGPAGYRWNNVNINHNYINHRVYNPGGRWAGYYPGWKPGDRPGYQPGQRPIAPGARPTPYQTRTNIYNRPGNEQRLASIGAKPGALPATGIKPGAPGAGVRPGAPGAGARPGAPGAGIKPGAPGAGLKPGAGQIAKPRPQPRPAGPKQNNVYGDKQGNVYRRGADGQWQQRQGNQWSKPEGPKTAAKRPQTGYKPETRLPQTRPQTRPGTDYGQLNREFQARQRGEMRTQQFQRQQFQTRPSGGYSGGGYRGGGGMPAGGGYRGGGGGGMRGGGGRGGRR